MATMDSRHQRLVKRRSGASWCTSQDDQAPHRQRQSLIMKPRNSHPIGDSLKACRLLKMPLRVRKVAKLHIPNVVIVKSERGLLEHATMPPRHQRMNRRRAEQPGNQRAVFDGIPTPVASPSQFVVRPPRPDQDSAAQHHPGEQGPRTSRSRPVRIQLPRGQRGDGQGRTERPKPNSPEKQSVGESAWRDAVRSDSVRHRRPAAYRLGAIGSAAKTIVATRKQQNPIKTPKAGSRNEPGKEARRRCGQKYQVRVPRKARTRAVAIRPARPTVTRPSSTTARGDWSTERRTQSRKSLTSKP